MYLYLFIFQKYFIFQDLNLILLRNIIARYGDNWYLYHFM